MDWMRAVHHPDLFGSINMEYMEVTAHRLYSLIN